MSDVPIQQRTRTGGGQAFHSKLEPFVGFIREQRQRRRTWREIADSLRCENGHEPGHSEHLPFASKMPAEVGVRSWL